MAGNVTNMHIMSAIKRRYVASSIGKSLLNVLGSLFPLLVSIVVVMIFNRKWSVSQFFMKGEFALYSAALVVASAHLVFKDYSAAKFPFRSLFGIFSIGIVVVASVIYTVLALIAEKIIGETYVFELNNDVFFTISFSLYVGAALIYFMSDLFDKAAEGIDLQEERNDRMENLSNEFDRL
ncbi:MAG: hypothetical protein K9K65_03555 [Desulfarculaceae bacterium]|nr:hypothetical protein [Desulfarculaceae bacterium]MCF8121660.1 hypothetical protein [Desulfarculaceae bacterium]